MFLSKPLLVLTLMQSFMIDKVFTQTYSIENLTYYRLRVKVNDNLESRELVRGQMNKNNTWVSSELVRGPDNVREIYFFKHMGDPDSHILLNLGKKKKVERPRYDARLLLWSKYYSDRFAFIHQSKKNNYEFYKVQFNDSPSEIKRKTQLTTSKPVLDIYDFHVTKLLDKDRFMGVVSYGVSDKAIPILGEDIFGITNLTVNTQEHREIVISSSVKGGNDNFVLLTNYDSDSNTDVYYYRSIFQMKRAKPIIIFSSDETLNAFQSDPSFSSNGDYIAFTENDKKEEQSYGSSVMKLIICPRPLYNEKTEKDIIPEKSQYIIIDDSLVTEERLELRSEFAMNYAWYPNEDVLFYIKEEGSKGFSKIWYYDVKTGVKKRLDTGTSMNHSISISDDGKYIVFTARPFPHGDKHFFNCPTKSADSNEYCCAISSPGVICVGELAKSH